MVFLAAAVEPVVELAAVADCAAAAYECVIRWFNLTYHTINLRELPEVR
jgi:hypothetical protein